MAWATNPPSRVTGDIEHMKAIPGTTTLVQAGYFNGFPPLGNGLAFSTDGGDTWDVRVVHELDEGLKPAALFFMTEEEGLVHFNERPSFKSNDTHVLSKGNWTGIMTTLNQTGHSQAKILHQHSMATSRAGGYVAKTTDGGKTWTSVLPVDRNYAVSDIECFRSVCIVTAQLDQDFLTVWKSVDAGQTWTQVYQMTEVESFGASIAMISEEDIWIGGAIRNGFQQGAFFHSVDGGATWEREIIGNGILLSWNLCASVQPDGRYGLYSTVVGLNDGTFMSYK